jgi:VIT1/CCC1 family predicted Fe2+/Mn2+ transporter
MSGDERPVRDVARRHIEEHARAEAARIGRLSRIREFVLGAQDGLLVPLGVVTGMAAANPGRRPILVAGLAEAVAGCIAMGGGGVRRFGRSYNEQWLIERHGYRTPTEARDRLRSQSAPAA